MEVFAILYLLPSGAVAIFYLMRKEQAAAARVWGICSGLPLAFLSIFSSPFIFPFIMAIGGAVLALRGPKLAGALMLGGAIGSVAALLVFASGVEGGDMAAVVLVIVLVPCLLSTSFLIPGGILALTSRKGQRASKKMVIVAITAFFLVPALFFAFLPALLGFARYLYFELF